jgi:hypothetical protein
VVMARVAEVELCGEVVEPWEYALAEACDVAAFCMADWARNAARKLEKKGLLVDMVVSGVFRPEQELCRSSGIYRRHLGCGLAEVRMLEGDFLGTPPGPRAPLGCYLQLMQESSAPVLRGVVVGGGADTSNVQVTYAGRGEGWHWVMWFVHATAAGRWRRGSDGGFGGVCCFLITEAGTLVE